MPYLSGSESSNQKEKKSLVRFSSSYGYYLGSIIIIPNEGSNRRET